MSRNCCCGAGRRGSDACPQKGTASHLTICSAATRAGQVEFASGDTVAALRRLLDTHLFDRPHHEHDPKLFRQLLDQAFEDTPNLATGRRPLWIPYRRRELEDAAIVVGHSPLERLDGNRW